jgi:ABC-2 type transport system permease protein
MQLWTVVLCEIRRMLRSRSFYFVLFALPFLLILILGSALKDIFSQDDRTIAPVRLAVASLDQGALQEGVQAFLGSPDLSKYLQPSPVVSREAAVDAVKSGEADFGLVIPDRFSESVLRGERANWEFLYGPSRTHNTTAEHVLQTFIDQTNTIQSVHLTIPSAAASAARLPASVSAGGESFVLTGSLNQANTAVSALQYYAAAELVMFLLYAGMMAAISLTTEKEQHTLARLGTLPVKPATVLAGKMAGQGFLAVVQAAVIVAGTSLLYGVDWGDNWGVLAAVILLTIAASMSLALLIAIIAKTYKAAVGLFQAVIIGMTLLSGGFMPVDGMLQKLGFFTVSYWASDSITRIMQGFGPDVVSGHLTVLAAIAGGLLAVSFAVYRKAGF